MINKFMHRFSTKTKGDVLKFLAFAFTGASILGGALWGLDQGRGSSSPLFQARPAPPPMIVSMGKIPRGGTLAQVLGDVPLPGEEFLRLTLSLKQVLDPRRLREGDGYKIVRFASGKIREMVLTQGLTEHVVTRSPEGTYSATTRQVPLTTVEHTASGTLDGSLWDSMVKGGISPDLIAAVADVFAWEIDFNVDPRSGDRFAVTWEDQKTPDGHVAARRILAALYTGSQTGRHAVVWFEGEHYNEDGASHQRTFLKAPLAFRRISSHFTLRRFHPILRYYRPHLGIDYAAPTGTPVRTVGDGTVVFKGRKGEFGNYVEVRHNGVYTTCYGHLSRFAKGLSIGKKVEQGDVIAYVGMTGMATGPHLDFRVRQNRKYVNFLTLKLPPKKSVPENRLAEFKALAQKRLSSLEGRTTVPPEPKPAHS